MRRLLLDIVDLSCSTWTHEDSVFGVVRLMMWWRVLETRGSKEIQMRRNPRQQNRTPQPPPPLPTIITTTAAASTIEKLQLTLPRRIPRFPRLRNLITSMFELVEAKLLTAIAWQKE